jgi:hypothetical protein
MATTAQIQAALATARNNDISYADMAAMLKAAIISAYLDGSGSLALPWQSTASDGTSITRVPLDGAHNLLKFCERMATGGVVSQLAEFSNPR